MTNTDRTIPLPKGYASNLDKKVQAAEDYDPKVGTSKGLTSIDHPETVHDNRDIVDATSTDPQPLGGGNVSADKEDILNNAKDAGAIQPDDAKQTDLGGLYDRNEVVDEDSDNLPAGSLGHPGIDDDTG